MRFIRPPGAWFRQTSFARAGQPRYAWSPSFPFEILPVVQIRVSASNPGIDCGIELEFEKFLDSVEKFLLILAYEGNCVTLGTSTAGTADPMNVILRASG